MKLEKQKLIQIHQIFEAFELMGFETRNKYKVLDEAGIQIGYAAEKRKGVLDMFFRQILGHWRRFDIYFYTNDRKEYLLAHHPFRFFFQRLNVTKPTGELIGGLQQRFSILYKAFDIENAQGNVIATMRSPIWRIWTFPIVKNGQEVGKVGKKWSGLLSEIFTDRDQFAVSYQNPGLSLEERQIMLAAAIFIDLQYFEKKARN